jgi:hypothetical protein
MPRLKELPNVRATGRIQLSTPPRALDPSLKTHGSRTTTHSEV